MLNSASTPVKFSLQLKTQLFHKTAAGSPRFFARWLYYA